MSIFKCKMCGGTIEFNPGDSVGICDSCGTKQTLPRLDDDRRANLYDRANHFRRNNEFDKAAGIYEQILTEDTTDAEAYWSIVLCRYGIEYVEDPATHRRVPTVNRAQFTSIFDDENYKLALQHADLSQKLIYEEEAAAINEIQKGILAISQKEEPFDVFICYKETDANGRRTQDSVLANDLYHQLTQEGFKVFFSRITLEDKLGTAYEPYIFAALNSAKVMVVLGTKPEHFNAVWVKNEWSRYLSVVKASGGKKILIPAYKDMDPYDLPEEFSHLQAQDMSKLGFMQDLIRGIRKIVTADEPKAVVKETVVLGENTHVAPLLRRAFLFLEDGNWDDADSYCEKVLDQDPENAEAYLGKLMAELHIRRREYLQDCEQPFDGSNNYRNAIRFGGEEMSSLLTGFINNINERLREKREESYRKAVPVINALQRRDGAISAESIEITLAQEKTKLKRLEQIQTVFDVKMEHIKMLQKELNEKTIQEKRLSEQRSKLGLFSRKEKKIIDDEISNLHQDKNRLNGEIAQLQIEIDRYEARTVLERDIADERKSVNDLETQLESLRASTDKEIGFAEALHIYLTDPLVTHAVNRELYPNMDEDSIAFGKYNPYQGLASDDIELKEILMSIYTEVAIEWKVLTRENGRMLVISKYSLDRQVYDQSHTGVTWATCSLRGWLNETFLKNAFIPEEQNMIASSSVRADKNPKHSTPAGINTTDKVFLLSIPEVNRYYDSGEARQCTSIAGTPCSWWLRSPGVTSEYAVLISETGFIDTTGSSVGYSQEVRPALWIDLGS